MIGKTLKKFLQTEFIGELSFDSVWEELESQHYDWENSPQAFSHNIICQYATIAIKFPKEKIPSRDRFIKRKLLDGMPQASKGKLSSFVEDEIPLQKFMQRLETERQNRLFIMTENIRKVEKSTLSPAKTPTPETPPLRENQDLVINNLEEEIKRLQQQFKSLSPRVPKLWCPYCRKSNHTQDTCYRKPLPGSCYDCLSRNCRRGHPNCPGRPNYHAQV